MSRFIRVKDTAGGEVTVPATYESAFGLKPLSKPAVDRFGRPLPHKPRTDPLRESAGWLCRCFPRLPGCRRY